MNTHVAVSDIRHNVVDTHAIVSTVRLDVSNTHDISTHHLLGEVQDAPSWCLRSLSATSCNASRSMPERPAVRQHHQFQYITRELTQ